MKPDEFAKAMSFLGLAYNKEFEQAQVEVWFTFFRDTDFSMFRQAVVRLISKSKFMPSIAEIKEELILIENPALQLSAVEEWDKVKKAISTYGYYRADDAVASLDPYTADIVRKVGGFQKICLSDDNEWTKKNFIQTFEEYSEHRRDALINGGHQTMLEQKRIEEIKALERKTMLLLEGE